MSVSYQAVGWNGFKKRYDQVLALGVVLYLSLFVGGGLVFFPTMTPEILLIRSFGSGAILLLHLILVIGPLARLDRRWLTLLYNRRHLGVCMFLLSLIHSILVVATYHAGGDINPIVSIFVQDMGATMGAFPFQVFGFLALLILFVMAATSHDFWLTNLTAPIWKTLHMSVYLAYAFLLVHVLFGVLQAETNPLYGVLLGLGTVAVVSVHLVADYRQRNLDREVTSSPGEDGFVPVCRVDELIEDVPLGVTVGGERVAILRYEANKISAVSGVCQHQNGPLAEGRYVSGCLTCPWHGYQYRPHDGASPAPFTEKVPTFELRLEDEQVWINPIPKPAGTNIKPLGAAL